MSARNLLGAVVLGGLIALFIGLWRSDSFGLARSWQTLGSAHDATSEPAPGAPAAAQREQPANALRVLFVGNSHTFLNDVPQLVARLAEAAKVERPLAFVMQARGGETLAGHLAGSAVRQRLAQQAWDFVVLQEQQQRPTFTWNPEQIEREFYEPVRTLDVLIRAAGARTILTMTAARREGDPANRPGDSYEAMQERSREAHMTVARQISARVAPVGLAWRALHRQRPELPLWVADGSHASMHGSYLAACVLFATLYEHSPVGNPYTAGLSSTDAVVLQEAAEVAR